MTLHVKSVIWSSKYKICLSLEKKDKTAVCRVMFSEEEEFVCEVQMRLCMQTLTHQEGQLVCVLTRRRHADGALKKQNKTICRQGSLCEIKSKKKTAKIAENYEICHLVNTHILIRNLFN